MRLGSETLRQRRYQARLANTSFAGDQYYLTFAIHRLRPAPQQQIEIFLPTNEARQGTRVDSLEAAFHRTRPQYRPGSLWPCDTFQVLRPQVLKLKQIAYELSRAFRDNDHIRRSDARLGVWQVAPAKVAPPSPSAKKRCGRPRRSATLARISSQPP
jgi:hypothetical protein